MNFLLLQLWFAFVNGFSGQILFERWCIGLYNVVSILHLSDRMQNLELQWHSFTVYVWEVYLSQSSVYLPGSTNISLGPLLL